MVINVRPIITIIRNSWEIQFFFTYNILWKLVLPIKNVFSFKPSVVMLSFDLKCQKIL